MTDFRRPTYCGTCDDGPFTEVEDAVAHALLWHSHDKEVVMKPRLDDAALLAYYGAAVVTSIVIGSAVVAGAIIGNIIKRVLP